MKKTLFFFLLAFIIGLHNVKSQNTIVMGLNWNGNHAISSQVPSDAVPYNNNDKSVHLQFLYTAFELTMGGATGPFMIDSIGWYVYSQISNPLVNYIIKMKNTTAQNTTVYDGAGLSVVRTAQALAPATDTAWYMLKLSSPFLWDGVSNLLIDICWGLNSISTPTGQIRHYSYGVNGERILIKSNISTQCNAPTVQVALFKPYCRLVPIMPNGTDELINNHLQLVSNNSQGEISFTSNERLLPQNIEVVDFMGKPVIFTFSESARAYTITVAQHGTFLTRIHAAQGISVFKVINFEN